MSRFEEENHSHSDVHHISDIELELIGGGDFYDGDKFKIDKATIDRAIELAKKYGMVITHGEGRWEGYSEYTPDPGDITCFTWQKADTVSKDLIFDNAITTLQGLKL